MFCDSGFLQCLSHGSIQQRKIDYEKEFKDKAWLKLEMTLRDSLLNLHTINEGCKFSILPEWSSLQVFLGRNRVLLLKQEDQWVLKMLKPRGYEIQESVLDTFNFVYSSLGHLQIVNQKNIRYSPEHIVEDLFVYLHSS